MRRKLFLNPRPTTNESTYLTFHFKENEFLLQIVEMCLTMCREQSILIKEQEWTKCRVLQKRGSCERNLKYFLWVLSKKNKSTQTSGSVFAERIEKAKKIKFELELIKIVDCFLDDHGSYDSNSVCFEKKCL